MSAIKIARAFPLIPGLFPWNCHSLRAYYLSTLHSAFRINNVKDPLREKEHSYSAIIDLLRSLLQFNFILLSTPLTSLQYTLWALISGDFRIYAVFFSVFASQQPTCRSAPSHQHLPPEAGRGTNERKRTTFPLLSLSSPPLPILRFCIWQMDLPSGTPLF